MQGRTRERVRSPKPEAKPPKSKAPKGDSAQLKKDKARYIELSYRIIEAKIMYYYPELIRAGFHEGLTISDDEFDKMQIEYLTLCRDNDFENTVCHNYFPGLDEITVRGRGMFEVDFKRPVVHLIMRKWGVPKWQSKVNFDTDMK